MTHTIPTDYPDWVRAMERRVQTVERNLGGRGGGGGGGSEVVAPFWGRLVRSTPYANIVPGTPRIVGWESMTTPGSTTGLQTFPTWSSSGITVPAAGIYSVVFRSSGTEPSGQRVSLQVLVNGSLQTFNQEWMPSGPNTNSHVLVGMLPLSAGDIVSGQIAASGSDATDMTATMGIGGPYGLGAQGIAGPQGFQGVPGGPGPQGPQGVPGSGGGGGSAEPTVLVPVVSLFDSNGTWTKPPNCVYIEVEIVGGGGGGGGTNVTTAGQCCAGGGGGGGGYAHGFMLATDVPDTVAVVIGAGGTGGTAASDYGGAGGQSGFGSYFQGGAGAGGRAELARSASMTAVGGAGGNGFGTGAAYYISGAFGETARGNLGVLGQAAAGGDTPFGPGARQSPNSANADGNAADAHTGGGGGGAVANGASAAHTGGAGGSGRGVVIAFCSQATTAGPQGPQGAIGTQGPQGAQGSQGLTGSGAQGVQGATGVQGPQGSQGATGAGTAGVQGAQGATGVQGPQGFQGSTGAGTQGAQGATGTQGPQGPQGFQGVTGAGVQGPQGGTGSQGPQGFQGSSGPQGIAGVQGPQGALGTQGPQGVQGAGTQGSQGTQGSPGSQGPQGPDPDSSEPLWGRVSRTTAIATLTAGTPVFPVWEFKTDPSAGSGLRSFESFLSGAGATTGGLVVPESGLYGVSVRWAGNGTAGGRMQVRLYVNGTTQQDEVVPVGAGSNGSRHVWLVPAIAGDVINADFMAATSNVTNASMALEVTGPLAPTMIVPTTQSVFYNTLQDGSGFMDELPPYGRITSVVYGGACRVRIYKTAAGRTADAGRPATTAYPGGAGLLYEYVAVGAETDDEIPVNIAWGAGETTYYYQMSGGPENVTINFAES